VVLKRTRPNAVSKKRVALNKERKAFVAQLLSERLSCEAQWFIYPFDKTHKCGRFPDDIHEPLSRARGGSILDPDNALAVCRYCHNWIHANPAMATESGLLKRSGLPSKSIKRLTENE